MIQSGYFLITDISGYTQFLTESELMHANEILTALLKVQVDNISMPFKVSRYQGDAIQTYAVDSDILRPQMILEMVENIYYEFKDHARQAEFNTTCDCAACSNIKNLDLKIFVHHGEFLVQNMGDQEELQGREVIVAHRLEKNTIKETYDLEAYAVFSQAAVDAAQMKTMTDEMISHCETYEHVGEIPLYVHDLGAAWAAEQARRKVIVKTEDAWAYGKIEIPVSQPYAWERMVDRESKQEYLPVNSVGETNLLNGRVGIETKYHCAHDLGDFLYTIVDWTPFSYFTAEEAAFGARYRKTYKLTELGADRTLFELLFAKPEFVEDSPMTIEALHTAYQSLVDETLLSFLEHVQK